MKKPRIVITLYIDIGELSHQELNSMRCLARSGHLHPVQCFYVILEDILSLCREFTLGILKFSSRHDPPLSYPFFSTSPSPSFLFFALAFVFLPLRSLFLRPCIPALQTSAYRVKKPSSLSASTTVDNLILSARCSFDLPLVARTRTGSGEVGPKYAKGASAGGDSGEEGEDEESGRVTMRKW
jgi:hypothetical protein